jgi:isocitrate dehydrogenase (NAD+)
MLLRVDDVGAWKAARSRYASFHARETRVVMAEAPHGTAPALQGKDIANPMAMILACGALLHHAASPAHPQTARASEAIYNATMAVTAAGVRTPDLGGHASMSEVTGEIVAQVCARLRG